jgi:hypothetical protein
MEDRRIRAVMQVIKLCLLVNVLAFAAACADLAEDSTPTSTPTPVRPVRADAGAGSDGLDGTLEKDPMSPGELDRQLDRLERTISGQQRKTGGQK